MITYRPFRNTDPPLLVELWNASLAGQRAVPVRSATLLEYFVFAKPYFEREGMHLALDGGAPVGFALTGPARDEPAAGVISAVAVLPSYRRRGIGSQLLQLAEGHLRRRGASVALGGGMAPDDPFLFGLYGGCSSPGVLAGDQGGRALLERCGYTLARTCAILQRSLTRLQMPADGRFPGIRNRYDIIAAPQRNAGRWRECVLGPVEAVEYRLQDKATNASPARMLLWDMDTFCLHWGQSCVGLIEFVVDEAERRKGLAKYLMGNVLRHLRERSFHVFEAQADPSSPAAMAIMGQFEFQQVETGHILRKTL